MIGRIGIYVFGGKLFLLMFMMVGILVRIVGVREIVVMMLFKDGKVNFYVFYVVKLFGIEEVYKFGGVGVIVVMVYGVGMRRVDKIFGFGNRFVNEVKR